MNTINVAAREYYSRPADQRMDSPQALVDAVTARKQASREVTWNAKDLQVMPVEAGDGSHGRIALASPRGQAELTPWSHGQLCRLVGAPAAYVRTLPSDVAAAALNHGLQASQVGTKAVVLAQRAPDTGTVTARAITTETYGRLWDADYYAPVVNTLSAQGWDTPPTWDGKPAGAYLSDRDSFLIMVNGGSIVSDPSARQGDGQQLYRGVMLRNSEVGLTSVWCDEVLFRFVCGNHMLWGAVYGAQFKRRHVGTAVLRDTLREIGALVRRVSTRPASADEQLIKALISTELAATKEGIVDELRKMGATQADAEAAYVATVQTENVSPRSFWGIAQGLTRVSQESGHQDDRLALDQLAAKVLSRGRQLVAA
jgi:hypothetical protein